MNINEIARLAGVSRATVSRYLNNGYVSEEKKQRIRQVIAETGYHPSNSAQTLRSRKTNYIGVIIPKINSDSISRMVSGISQTLSGYGYQLLLACTNNREQEELRYLELFKENHVDGIILLGTIFSSSHKKALNGIAVPLVILGQYLKGYSCVYSDDYAAAHALAAHLAKSGKCFGYLGVTTKDAAVGKNRRRGFTDALLETGITVPDNHFCECSFQMDSGYEQARHLLEAVPGIDTLVCATDTLALGALQYLKTAGFKIPADIQLAGMGDNIMTTLTDPPLTTVHFYYEEAGTEAARLLLELIESKDSAISKDIKLGCQLLLKPSTLN